MKTKDTLTDAMAAWVSQMHTERYPDGCGHHETATGRDARCPQYRNMCEACCARVGGRETLVHRLRLMPTAWRDGHVVRALAVLVFTDSSRTFLLEADPKALFQAERALVTDHPVAADHDCDSCPDCRAKAGWKL